MRITVTHSIGELAADLTRATKRVPTKGPAVVKKNIKAGNKLAVGFSQGASGPHGSNLYKRLSFEMTGALEGEFGYEGTEFVGGGFRNAPPNRDLPKAADAIGPKFADDAGDLLDGLL